MKTITRKIIMLAICTLISAACLITIANLGKSAGRGLVIGSYMLPVASLQGIISAINMLICILMVFIHYEYGSKIAFCVVVCSTFYSIAQIIHTHALYSLPGIISAAVSLFSIAVIYVFYKRSSLNSYTDFVTGLNNRRRFMSDIEDKLQSKKGFCLACVEVEGFKRINDTYGMQAGDVVLQKTAERLIREIGSKKHIYKITGAIFIIILNDAIFAQDILMGLVKPEKITLPIKKGEPSDCIPVVTVSLAAGLARYPDDATDSTELLTHADAALTAAKKSENKKICFYTRNLEAAEKKQREAEELVHEALENKWFYLVYQPQFTLSDRKLRGFETLIRCKRPDGSVISPAEFIPAAEKTNLIFKIDDYVLKRAMEEFKPVLDEKDSDYIISVNVSAKNISTPDFALRVKKLLDETAFPARSLEIEITEYSLADSMDITIANIQKLKEFGVQVALDDFGTGYTSIAQLMKLPINLLKIDKSLIDNIESNQNIRDLVDSVIYMGHVMNCEVISEGVENEQQIGVLKAHNCDFVQGFVWGKPLPFRDAVNLC